MKTRDELENERRRGEERQEKSFIGVGGAILIIVGGLAIWLFVTLVKPAQPLPRAPASSASVLTDSLQCDRLIQIAQREGIVRGDRLGNRILVDRKRWSALAPGKKSDLIQYVACAAFDGRRLDALDDGEVVEVVSADDRKPLAKAGRLNGAVFTMDY